MSNLGSRILLVEDNADDELLTVRALKSRNVANEIDIARDGEEAVARLQDEEAPLPQLVLLDLKLPKVDGLEVLAAIRENPRTQNLPVVILTSSNEESDLVQGYALGANSYIRKPVEFESFIDAVERLGMYWLVLNEPPPTRS